MNLTSCEVFVLYKYQENNENLYQIYAYKSNSMYISLIKFFFHFHIIFSYYLSNLVMLVLKLNLTLVMLNKLRCHAHFNFSANQTT